MNFKTKTTVTDANPFQTGRRFNAKAYVAYRRRVQAAMTAERDIPIRDVAAEYDQYREMYNM